MRLIDADQFGVIALQGKSEEFIEGVKFILEKIDEAPTVEPKQGEWIYHKEWKFNGECAFECSKCGMGTDVDYNFCPNCGARLKEGDEK